MIILAARKYPSQRNGLLSLEQTETRRLAYAIKSIASPSTDFNTAALEMAALISGACWLVPMPDSTGNTDANTRLAAMIARHVASAAGTLSAGGEGRGEVACCQVVKAIVRTRPIQSQCSRHKLALGPIPPDQHHFARTNKLLTFAKPGLWTTSPPAATPLKPLAPPSVSALVSSSPTPPPAASRFKQPFYKVAPAR
jgi:hypothetical protein